jgi:hypothetical protein
MAIKLQKAPGVGSSPKAWLDSSPDQSAEDVLVQSKPSATNGGRHHCGVAGLLEPDEDTDPKIAKN